MKRKSLFSFLLMALLTLSLLISKSPVDALADGEGEDYTYTVRIYAGAQGTINGQEVLVYENVPYGTEILFSIGSVEVTNAKYYVRGIRESGKDNNTIALPRIVVDRDVDYVVGYGILGAAVSYTISYVDQNGTALAPSETYYGNVGDKPVVAYLYVEGYQPQYYNITGTLSANAADNVFTFVYNPIPAQQEESSGTDSGESSSGAGGDSSSTPAGESSGTEPGESSGSQSGESSETSGGSENSENTNPAENSGENSGDNAEQSSTEPQEILDIDVPMADGDNSGANGEGEVPGSNAGTQSFFTTPGGIATIAGGVLVVGGGLWWILAAAKRKKKKDEDDATK